MKSGFIVCVRDEKNIPCAGKKKIPVHGTNDRIEVMAVDLPSVASPPPCHVPQSREHIHSIERS